jgi:hypothetical protein
MSGLKSAYKILPNHSLIIEYHTGEMLAGNYIDFKQKLLKAPLFNPNLKYFVHFKNVKFDITQLNIDKFIGFIENNVQTIGKRKIAIITNTPNQVVTSTKYKLAQDKKRESIEIFTTHQSALKWLNIPGLSNDKLDTILKELQLEINP